MIAEVVVNRSNINIDKTFDYVVDDGVTIGSRVLVDFAHSTLIGIVVGIKEKSDFAYLKKAKYLDTPLDDKKIKLMQYMVQTYHLKMADVLGLFIPKKMREQAEPERGKIFYQISSALSEEEMRSKIRSSAVRQQECLEYMLLYSGEYGTILTEHFGAAAIKGLEEKQILVKSNRYENRNNINALKRDKKDIVLTPLQQNAVDTIMGSNSKFLLHGVTGSGKTEIYKKIIKEEIANGKSAVMLVPEISLTPQMLGTFRQDFGDSVAVLHSKLNETERYNEWKKIHDGEASIVIGPRSAIFAPCVNLGVVIIDEEHDNSYISESNPRYDTKNVAEKVSELYGCKLILGSATPDVETYYRAENGAYKIIKLDKRISQHDMHEVEILDVRRENLVGGVFSQVLLQAIKTALDNKEQVMILLNRRGYYPHTVCSSCGEPIKCLNCDVGLTYHADENVMMCHYCGTKYHVVTKCPKCGSKQMRSYSYGTEKLAQTIQSIFPESNVMRMDFDTVNRKNSYYEILTAFQEHKADILVGTQMIAKGHDFSNVTVVGILEMDRQLYRCDYMATERTFQLATQVSGRAGRADKKGRVMLQTFSPNHYVYYYVRNNDYDGFYKKELTIREGTKFPPFARIVRIMFNGIDKREILDTMKPIYLAIKELQEKYGSYIYLNAGEALLGKAKNTLRYNIIIRMEKSQFDKVIGEIYNEVDKNKTKGVLTFVEIDPHNMA